MSEKTTYPSEQKNAHEHTASSSCSETTGSHYVPDANTIPETPNPTELAMNASLYVDSVVKGSPETRQDNTIKAQGSKQGTGEGNIQLHYLSDAVMHNSFQPTDSPTKQSTTTPGVVGDMSSEGNFGACFKEITREPQDTSVSPSIESSVSLQAPQLNRISTAPSSHQEPKLLSEGLSFQNPVGKQDIFNQNLFAQEISAQDKSVPHATAQNDPVPILRLSRISVAPPSHPANRLQIEELSSQDSVIRKDGFKQKVSGQNVTKKDTAISPILSLLCHVPTGGKDQKQICDTSFENPTAFQQLFSPSRETNGSKNIGAGVLNVTSVSTQVAAEQKEPDKNEQIVLSQAVLKTEGNLITNTASGFNSSNPYGQMEEIDLNDDSAEPEVETIRPASTASQPLRVDLSKYAELLGQHKATVTFLKRSVVKSVIAGRNKLKDVVNETLSVASKSQDNHTPNTLVSADDNFPPSISTPNSLNTAPSDISRGGTSPYFSPPRSKSIHDPMFQHNLAAGFGNVTGADTTRMKDNPAQFIHSPGFTDRSRNEMILSSPVTHPQLNNYNIPFHVVPGNQASFLHSAVPQTPGHSRGYALYPPPYAFRIPPPLPPPPPVPAMEYFASRYCASGHSTLAASPVVGISPPNIDRTQFGKMQGGGSPILRQANYVTSMFHVKSNQIRDSLQRKISSSLSQTARADPDADFFMEEGRLNRSHIVTGSDQCRRHGLHYLTVDDLLMGALCCCCWPLGLAARLVTLTIPDSDGPVDSCIKSMSHKITSISLVLGIASYLVFFVLWLSLFIVAAK